MINGLTRLADVEDIEVLPVITTDPTWEEMVKIEPKLAELLKEAEGCKRIAMRDTEFCAARVWHGRDGMKSKMSELVGFFAGDGRLTSAKCYELAYQKIYKSLPDCRHEGGPC
ncbi:MAG: hypothetical protein WC834_00195 [Eubacteriales bacterium]